MKILLISIGTRGDVEPFLAQAELLKEAGHEVSCLFPEQFRETVDQMGFSFLGFDRRSQGRRHGGKMIPEADPTALFQLITQE